MFLRRKRTFTSPKEKERRRKRYVLKALAAFLFIVCVMGGLSWLSWRKEFSIQSIAIRGNATLSEEDIRNHVRERLSGSYLYLFSRASVFLFQPSRTEENLLETFKKIQDVAVSRAGKTSITIEIEERKPFYVWCDIEINDVSADACYFLDIDGFAFAPAPYFSGHIYFEFHRPFGEGVESPVGLRFLEETEFKRVIGLRNALREAGFNIYGFSMEETGDYALLLSEGGKILFHPNQDFDIVFQNIIAAVESDAFLRKKKKDVSLEYIDARFGNKIYYRFQ